MRRRAYLPVPTELPAFYDDLVLSLAEVQRIIAAGASDRRKAAHCPVVATLDTDGAPSQRVMILRAVDWEHRTLRFHTDARSNKIGEIARNGKASVLFYEPEDKAQVRLTGTARTEMTDGVADTCWDSSTLFARRCYMGETGPGMPSEYPVSGLPEWVEGRQPTDEEVAPARQNFAVLLVEFERMEWLYLANAGHRRARWVWQDGWHGGWLIP